MEDPGGLYANSLGEFMFAGHTNRSEKRRALIGFDVGAALPKGATVTGVELSLTMTRTRADEKPVGLHRVLAAWGEGASKATGQQGTGDIAVEGDATWQFRVFETIRWERPGGDFEAVASATAEVGGEGRYSWESTPELGADVQGWLDDPASNHGWLIVGDETGRQTAKRFATRESADEGQWPLLTVTFAGG